ncbi:DUF1367 family protein [Aureimonas pseudogalii]|uniref:Uncharacterized protein n=1 Tax=Aureimonas pseudogalii TaxID=1744844 RepID=A0A7W6H318_9HYPH|nr:DUF1367 family protein [Aureimonas pseudogalii]MBB3997250.1 hypothetical protein [Aureimonas pseudogalii]
MTKAVFRKMAMPQGDVLIPTDEDGRDMVRALKSMKDVIVDVHAARNPRHHRMLFLLFKKLEDGGAWEGDMDSLLDWMKFATGHVRTVIDHNGQVHTVPKSIAFESMDQAQFSRWFSRVLFVICERLLQGHSWEALRDEIVEVTDGRFEAQRKAA